ncbi:hypothetical protein [Catellatospora tritici]|uniref:hypothetical protein n=1 Tax=Catellatospora tritici TaxID=2851566 RepID=UPI001C2D0C38|nr:hypothetical protein [Catellatospora tritici]MBV1849694.1 hypothetical protein [Catellatospora tritici]
MTSPYAAAHPGTADFPTLHKAIPAGLPFEVRLTSGWGHALRHRRAEIIMLYVFGLLCLVGAIIFITGPDETVHSNRGDMNSHLIGWLTLIMAGFFLLSTPVSTWWLMRKPVLLAADAHGVFVRPNGDKERALHLPWATIETVAVRRWRGPQLIVKPRDPRIEDQFKLKQQARGMDQRAGVAIAQKLRLRKLGTNIHVPVGGVASSPQELLMALQYQAAGRCPIELA